MTFHLGGLNMETLRFWRWGSQWPLGRGRLIQEGTVNVQYRPFPLLAPLAPPPSPEAPVGLPAGAVQETPPSLGGTETGPFLPIPGDSSRRSSLARRRGVSETAGAQVAFAKHLINRPGIVPTSHTVFKPASLHRSLEQDDSCNYCLAILPRTLLSRPGRGPSLGATQHSTSLLAPPSPTLALSVTPPVGLMSVGLDPPQVAARWPLPKLLRHLCCGWEGRGGRREARGVGFTSRQPWYLACPFLAAHPSEAPTANWWIKCFLFTLPHLLGQCALRAPQLAVLELLLRLAAPSPFLGLLKWELRCNVFGCPLPTGGGWGRASPGPREQSSAQLSTRSLPVTP